MKSPIAARPTFIDLFCGSGGFSLGMIRAGFRCLAAIDSNAEAIFTFSENFKGVPNILQADLTKFPPLRLAPRLGDERVDVIVGGPPCQGFSHVRQVDAANHGSRVKRDKRRYFYRVFLDYVRHFKPQVFIMENVLGIQSAVKGKIFTRVQAEARALGYRVHPQVEEAWMLGVPQKRRRQLIIGVRGDVPGYFPVDLIPAPRAFPVGMAPAPSTPSLRRSEPLRPTTGPTLWDAIGDLPPLEAGTGEADRAYDLSLREQFIEERGIRASHYLTNTLEIIRAETLTGHCARPHSERDLRDFGRLAEGEHAAEAIARGERMEFPYNRECFRDRFKRQHREELCSTIVAHLGKDGLMFIHPTQQRSLTPREAARIQSFPDWFLFPVHRTHQYRLIGNAVPPLVGEAVGLEAKRFLERAVAAQPQFLLAPLPSSEGEALSWLLPMLDLNHHALRKVAIDVFKRAWYAQAFLYPGLHPDSAIDHGSSICRKPEGEYLSYNISDPRLVTPYYERSGWPVILEPFLKEARRRFRLGDLETDQFYCMEAQIAGMYNQSTKTSKWDRERETWHAA